MTYRVRIALVVADAAGGGHVAEETVEELPAVVALHDVPVWVLGHRLREARADARDELPRVVAHRPPLMTERAAIVQTHRVVSEVAPQDGEPQSVARRA